MIFGTTLLKDQEFGDAFVDVATSEKRLIRVTTNTYQSPGGTYITIKLFKRRDDRDNFCMQQRVALTVKEFQLLMANTENIRLGPVSSEDAMREKPNKRVKENKSGCAGEEKAKRPRYERQLISKSFWSHDFLHIAVFGFPFTLFWLINCIHENFESSSQIGGVQTVTLHVWKNISGGFSSWHLHLIQRFKTSKKSLVLVRLLSQIEGCNLSRDLHVVELFSHVSVQSVAFAIDNVSEIHWFVKKSWLKQCTNDILIISNSIEKISGTSCLKMNQALDWIFHRDQTMRSVFMRRLLIISGMVLGFQRFARVTWRWFNQSLLQYRWRKTSVCIWDTKETRNHHNEGLPSSPKENENEWRWKTDFSSVTVGPDRVVTNLQ